jgi:hypothetical protein
VLQDVALGNGTLVSPVLGSSVTNLSISNLRENIQFSICSPHSTQVNRMSELRSRSAEKGFVSFNECVFS